MKWFARLLLAVFTMVASAVSAQATVFPPEGGKGDRAEEVRCPSGHVLVGFQGRTGSWIDQISLMCAPLVIPGFTTKDALVLPPPKGGNGGSPASRYCERDAAIRGITIRVLEEFAFKPFGQSVSRPTYVRDIQFSCSRPRDGSATVGGGFGGNWDDSYYNPNKGNLILASPKLQACPGNEYASGITIRHGKYVNAVGLICAVLAPSAPPITMTGGGDLIEPGMEDNTDRAGADYTRFEIANPKACQIQCKNESDRCRAWTFVRPGVQGPRAVCYLKTAEGDARPNSCCISGVNRKVTGLGKKPVPEVPTGPTGTAPGAMQEPGGFANATARRCKPGFVWREARPADVVCVTPESRSMVAQENAVAPSRWDANGAYGPNTCIAGFVWREAFEGDITCVTPERRAAVKEENRVGPSRAE